LVKGNVASIWACVQVDQILAIPSVLTCIAAHHLPLINE